MSLQKLMGEEKAIEVKRLGEIKADFMDKYQGLCRQFEAQLVPVITPLGEGNFQLQMQLDSCKPVQPTPEEISKLENEIINQTKNETK